MYLHKNYILYIPDFGGMRTLLGISLALDFEFIKVKFSVEDLPYKFANVSYWSGLSDIQKVIF